VQTNNQIADKSQSICKAWLPPGKAKPAKPLSAAEVMRRKIRFVRRAEPKIKAYWAKQLINRGGTTKIQILFKPLQQGQRRHRAKIRSNFATTRADSGGGGGSSGDGGGSSGDGEPAHSPRPSLDERDAA
jgi:uncharacterized membrane protein YgcG